MKTILTLLVASLLATTGLATNGMAAETLDEKAAASGNDLKRSVKKGMNRAEEALCAEGDVKCAAEKAGNRVEEIKDATVDKTKEYKNKID